MELVFECYWYSVERAAHVIILVEMYIQFLSPVNCVINAYVKQGIVLLEVSAIVNHEYLKLTN